MLRTSLSIIAMTLLAGAAQAAPVPAPADTSSLVINVVSDATSEDDAIELDQNTLPNAGGGAMEKSQPSPSEGPAERRQMEESDIINN